MSGAIARRPGTNVVPMPAAAPPAQGTMMPNPMMWSGGSFPAGCCPPGGMDALLQCYCDVQSATAFISKVVQDLAANDPAFQQSLVDAIVASGSNIPLIGVTNGSDAQPGQVGEYVQIEVQAPFTAATQTQSVTMGVLQPGDWDVWQFCTFSVAITGAQFSLSPAPAGFSHLMFAADEPGGTVSGIVLTSAAARASVSVPTLVVFSLLTNGTTAGPSAGTANMFFCARRRR